MAGYLGHKPSIKNYTVNEFNPPTAAEASSGNFILSQTVLAASLIEVSVGGIDQPTTAYSVSGTTLAFGVGVITVNDAVIVRFAGDSLQYPALEAGSVDSAEIVAGAVDDAHLASSGTMPAWNGSALTNLPTSLDGSPDTDNTANGPQTNTFASGYQASITDLVVIGNASKWIEADADNTATSIGLLGIALEAKNDTQLMNVALSGSFIRGDGWSWTPGAPLYIGNNLGAMVEAKPTGTGDIVRTVGYAVTPTVIFFTPSSDYVTLA